MVVVHHVFNYKLNYMVNWNRLLKSSQQEIYHIFVSEIIKTSSFPLIWSTNNSNLFLIEFILKWVKTNLFEFSVHVDFKMLLVSILILSLSESFNLHSQSNELEISLG